MHLDEYTVQLTFGAQLLRNPRSFFRTLWAHFVVDNEAVALRKRCIGLLSSSIKRSKCHGVDTTADSKAYT
jgi:hypothetical protein